MRAKILHVIVEVMLMQTSLIDYVPELFVTDYQVSLSRWIKEEDSN